MSAKLVPTTRTSYNQDQLIEGFVEGWQKQFGALPSKQSIGVLYAQNSLETGGTVSMWNNNLGNVKFVPSHNPDDDNGKEYMMLANVWEIVNGQKVIFQPPSQATWFRAFETLADGVAFHLDFLKNHRYKAAWAAVESGDPAQFAHLLRAAGYYTAPEADYVRAMNAYYNKYMKANTFETAVAKLQAPVTAPEPINVPEPVTPIETLPESNTDNVQPSIPAAPVAPEGKSIWDAILSIFSTLFKRK
jgi:hypothetical protein